MSYAGSRRIIDVDRHVIELDDFLWNAASDRERERLPKMADQKVLPRTRASHAERRGWGDAQRLDAAARYRSTRRVARRWDPSGNRHDTTTRT